MQCPAFVYNLKVNCCLDTGASVVYINEKVVKEIQSRGLYLNIKRVGKPITVKLGDSSKSTCIKQVELPLTFNESIYPITAYILKNLPYDVMLGMSFFTKYDASIHPAIKTLILDTDFNPPIGVLENPHLFLTETITIPPLSETIVLTRSTIPCKSKAISKSYTNLAERLNIYSAKGLIDCSNTDISIVLANLGSTTRVLPKGTLVSCLKFCDESEWHIKSFSEKDDYKELNILHNESGEQSESENTNDDLPSGLDFSNLNINSEQLVELKAIIIRYRDLFSSNPKGPTPTNAVFHEINTGENKPVNQPPHRSEPAQRSIIEKIVKEMKENKVIKPSKSPWASPIVLVSKKDGSTRFCVDYRKVNAITKKDVYPLPRIDDTLNALGNCKYFSSFDLASGYWQIPMSPQDQEKTAFISHTGLVEFTVMPFGLCNAPATFQRFMDITLAGLKWKSCIVYFDDIIVFSPTFEQHLLDVVFI